MPSNHELKYQSCLAIYLFHFLTMALATPSQQHLQPGRWDLSAACLIIRAVFAGGVGPQRVLPHRDVRVAGDGPRIGPQGPLEVRRRTSGLGRSKGYLQQLADLRGSKAVVCLGKSRRKIPQTFKFNAKILCQHLWSHFDSPKKNNTFRSKKIDKKHLMRPTRHLGDCQE